MKIIIDGIKYEVVTEFPVLFQGWECDDVGYVVKKDDKCCLVMSDHGRLYFAKNKTLENKIEEYKNAINASKKALNLVYGGNKEE